MDNFFDRSFTVYDEQLEIPGNVLLGGYVMACVFASKEQADAVLAQYRANPRYSVRPSGAQSVAEKAQEIAARYV